MTDQNPAVKLTRARLLQLQLLAASIGSTVAGAIEALVSAAAERGEIPDALDGVGIERRGENVVLTLAGQVLPPLSIAEARTLASRLFGALGAVPFDSNARLSRPLPSGFDREMHTAWTCFGYVRFRTKWSWILSTLRNSGMDLMTPEQREAHASLPAVVTIWRGFAVRNAPDHLADIEDAARGVSWTTARGVAESYAGFGASDDVRCLARAVVPRETIHSYFGLWHSHECVMDRPDEIKGIEAKRLPTPAPRLLVRGGLAALANLGGRGFALMQP